MNFTREPIILSVITPKEGCKLVIRNFFSEVEDFFVDSVEIVSFQNAIFFRSLERPKSFLLPTTHYEVLEVKETKMVLKTNSEKPIKITPEKEKNKKKKIKRRKPTPEPPEQKGGDTKDETGVSSSVLKKLFPPPNTLIKEKLERIKSEEFFEENILPGNVEENTEENKEDKQE